VTARVEGISYDDLVANATLQAAIERQMQVSIAEAAGVSTEAVSVLLSKGSLIVTASITPSADSFAALATKLGGSSLQATLAVKVAEAASTLPGIALVTTGKIEATIEAVTTPAPSPAGAPTPVSPRDGYPHTSFGDRAPARCLATTVLLLFAVCRFLVEG